MSTSVISREPVPTYADDLAWARRLTSDAARIDNHLPAGLRDLHTQVVDRARKRGASGLVLSGSTARGRRTDISDLDYHLVGTAVDTDDLSRELDLHVLTPDKLQQRRLAGDDFVQWSLRFGCIVFDAGVLRDALQLISERRLWPDVDRKMQRARKSLDIAGRFVETGDEDGALVQVRTALSLAARARLLSAGVFPLSRAELPAQLELLGLRDVAKALTATIYDVPTLGALRQGVLDGEEMLRSVSVAGHESPSGRTAQLAKKDGALVATGTTVIDDEDVSGLINKGRR
jgi:hypothetical protein